MNMNEILAIIKEYVPAEIMSYIEAYLFVAVLAAAVVCGIVALYSYKLFRIELVIEGILLFGILGGVVLGPWLENALTFIPDSISISAILGILLAIIGGFIMHFFFKFALFITGAAIGWFGMYSFGLGFLAEKFPDFAFFQDNAGKIIIPILTAIILGVIFIFLFKFLYIILTSFGGMCGAAVLLGLAIVPDGGMVVLIASLVVGAIAGICATVYQYKNNSKYRYYIMK